MARPNHFDILTSPGGRGVKTGPYENKSLLEIDHSTNFLRSWDVKVSKSKFSHVHLEI